MAINRGNFFIFLTLFLLFFPIVTEAEGEESSKDGKENRSEKSGVFDFSTKTVLLNSGYSMPLYGIGTYSLTGQVCKEALKMALKEGVRLIDTAFMYGNEREVGEAIKESGVSRSEIFLITKLYPTQYQDAKAAIKQAYDKLDIVYLGYIDLVLLHHPGEGDVKAYKELEEEVKRGRIRSLGLSNYYIKELKEFLPKVSIKPSLVQNEVHPYYQEQGVIPFIQRQGLVTQSWYPLGGRGYQEELFKDKTLTLIAKRHNVSVAQVMLRWALQRSIAVIPGSKNPEHIKENTSLFNFTLEESEMNDIARLDRGEKHDWY